MKQAFISVDINHQKKMKLKLWVNFVIILLIIVGSVGVIFNTASASKNKNNLLKDLSRNSYLDKVDENEQESVNNRIFAKKKLGSQMLKLKNLVASQEIKEAEDYLAELTKKSKDLRRLAVKLDTTSIAYDFSSPLKKGHISSPYGNRRDPINGSIRHHGGLDIAAKTGSYVYAIANGFVTFQGRKGAYGNLLEINHSESLKSRYAHLDSFLVEKGQLVKKGDLIGKVGATGRVTGPHLHLEIRENNKIKNPADFLKGALKGL